MPALTGRVAIITGASRGIGRAIAMRLTREGASVVLCARDERALQSAVQEARGAASYIALDLRVPDAPAKLVAFTIEKFGSINIVVNNAGATKRAPFDELTDDDWADGFALKFFGTVRLTRAAWPHLKACGSGQEAGRGSGDPPYIASPGDAPYSTSGGSVVNIAGAGGRTPGAEFTIGGSVNAAIQSFSKAMADAGIADGVQVNVVNPGLIRTGRLEKRLTALSKEKGINLAEAEREIVASSKVTRIGEPEDVAALVTFIVSPEGRLLQGAMIDMDAGATKTL